MGEATERDAALLLDMLLAARDARGFVAGTDEVTFLASRLHQSAVIRALEVIGEAAGKVWPAFRAGQTTIPTARHYCPAPPPHPRLRRGAARPRLAGGDGGPRSIGRGSGAVDRRGRGGGHAMLSVSPIS
jgi:hypothetical protein